MSGPTASDDESCIRTSMIKRIKAESPASCSTLKGRHSSNGSSSIMNNKRAAAASNKRGAATVLGNGELYVPGSRRSRSCKDKVTSVGDYIRTVMQQLQSAADEAAQSSDHLQPTGCNGGIADSSANNARLAYNSRQRPAGPAAAPSSTSSRATRTAARTTPSSASAGSSSAEQQVWLMIVERMREEIIKARDVHRANLYNQSKSSSSSSAYVYKRRRVLSVINDGVDDRLQQKTNNGGGADDQLLYCSVCSPNTDQSAAMVITVCGHYLCWDCLCKWHHKDASSSLTASKKECPCCKKILSKSQVSFVGEKHEDLQNMEGDASAGAGSNPVSNYLATDQRDKLLQAAAIPILTSRLQAKYLHYHHDLQSVYEPSNGDDHLAAICTGQVGSTDEEGHELSVHKSALPGVSGHSNEAGHGLSVYSPAGHGHAGSGPDEAGLLGAMAIDHKSDAGEISRTCRKPSSTEAYISNPFELGIRGGQLIFSKHPIDSHYETLRASEQCDMSMNISKQLQPAQVALLIAGGEENPNYFTSCEKQENGDESPAQLNNIAMTGCTPLGCGDGGLCFTPTSSADDNGGQQLGITFRPAEANYADVRDFDVFEYNRSAASGAANDISYNITAPAAPMNGYYDSDTYIMSRHTAPNPISWPAASPLASNFSPAEGINLLDSGNGFSNTNKQQSATYNSHYGIDAAATNCMSQFNSQDQSSSYDYVANLTEYAEAGSRPAAAMDDVGQYIQSLLEIQATDAAFTEAEINELRHLQEALKQVQQKPLSLQSSPWLSTLILASTSTKYSDEYLNLNKEAVAPPYGYFKNHQADLIIEPPQAQIFNNFDANCINNDLQNPSQLINNAGYSPSSAEQQQLAGALNLSSESTFSSASVPSNNSSSANNHFSDIARPAAFAPASCPHQDDAISNWRSLYDAEAWDWPI